MTDTRARAIEAERLADEALGAGRLGESQRHMFEAERLWRLVERREDAASVSATIAQRGRGIIEASIRDAMEVCDE